LDQWYQRWDIRSNNGTIVRGPVLIGNIDLGPPPAGCFEYHIAECQDDLRLHVRTALGSKGEKCNRSGNMEDNRGDGAVKAVVSDGGPGGRILVDLEEKKGARVPSGSQNVIAALVP
jgi:hypothetical protein